MKAVFNSKERESADWESLLHRADPRFNLVKIHQAPTSALALLEVLWNAI